MYLGETKITLPGLINPVIQHEVTMYSYMYMDALLDILEDPSFFS